MAVKFRHFWRQHHLRILVLALLLLALGASALVLEQIATERSLLLAQQQLEDIRHHSFLSVANDLQSLQAKIVSYKAEGVDTATVEAQVPAIKTALFTDKDPPKAALLIKGADTALEQLHNQKLAADEAASERLANQATVSGKVTEGATPLVSVTISLISGSTEVSKTSSDVAGSYLLKADPGTYTLAASKSGYATFRKYNLILTAKQLVSLDISLTKAVSTSTTTTSGGSTAHSSYERKTVTSSRGSFLVDLVTLDLASGGIRVLTDTANDNDCLDGCPTKSVSSFVGGNGGFAGINGTYFCPADYSSCAGQVGSFFWKVRNTRLGKTINETNGKGENEPYLTFSSSGRATYYSSWISAPKNVYAGINCGPRLIENGAIVLTEASMDDKQRTVKSNRGALGLKGQTLYAVVARSATVPDMASILAALGVDSALNLDGGGSSALYYKGAYKVGPGRNIPNAVIFAGG